MIVHVFSECSAFLLLFSLYHTLVAVSVSCLCKMSCCVRLEEFLYPAFCDLMHGLQGSSSVSVNMNLLFLVTCVVFIALPGR